MNEASDDDAAFVNRPRTLMGLSFDNEEDRTIATRIAAACGGIIGLSIGLFFAHVHHRGQSIHAIFHLFVAMALPAMGYFGVKKGNTKWIWIFHITAVLFSVMHVLIAMRMFHTIHQMWSRTPTEICHQMMDLEPEAAWQRVYARCEADIADRQSHAGWLLFWWCITTGPLCFLQLFCAHYAHEYYFRLRVRSLTIRTGADGVGTVFQGSHMHMGDSIVE